MLISLYSFVVLRSLNVTLFTYNPVTFYRQQTQPSVVYTNNLGLVVQSILGLTP